MDRSMGFFKARDRCMSCRMWNFFKKFILKQFSAFHSRSLPIILRLQSGHKIHLLGAIGARWRRQRHVINPTFSSAKLKLMLPLVKQCIDAMLTKVSDLINDQNTEINIYNLYKRMTMDVICKQINISHLKTS